MLSQIIAVTGVNLRSIGQRLGSSAVAIVGIAGVIVVFLGVLSIGEGFRKAMADVGDPQTVMVMRAGSDTEMTSGFGGDTVRLILDTPGIARDASGPIASSELFVIVGHPSKKDPSDANVPLRGLSTAALKVRPTVKIVEGRMFTEGTNEIVVGRAASNRPNTAGSTGARSAVNPVRTNIRCRVVSLGAQPSWACRIRRTCAAERDGFSFFNAAASSNTSGGVRGWDWRGEGTSASNPPSR